MSDYSWIKPGVKAVVIASATFPEMVGEVVTIAGRTLADCGTPAVDIEERVPFIIAMERPGIFTPALSALKPYRDDSRDLGSWSEVNEILGQDIREGVVV